MKIASTQITQLVMYLVRIRTNFITKRYMHACREYCSSKSSTNATTTETWCAYWDKLDNLPYLGLSCYSPILEFSFPVLVIYPCVNAMKTKTIISKMRHKIWSWIIKHIPKYFISTSCSCAILSILCAFISWSFSWFFTVPSSVSSLCTCSRLSLLLTKHCSSSRLKSPIVSSNGALLKKKATHSLYFTMLKTISPSQNVHSFPFLMNLNSQKTPSKNISTELEF